jgi:hypothetical protein
MKLKSSIVLLGAFFSILVIAALCIGLKISWLTLGIVVILSVLGYIVAAVSAASRITTSSFGEFMRGWLIGLNTGLNGFLAFALFNYLGGIPVAIIIGASIALLNLITVFGPVSNNEVFQGILGWLTWLMPMSWLVVLLGAIFYLICLLGHAVTGGKVAYLKIQDAAVDWKTGTFFIKGGLISNLNYLDTAFNMGNFSFVDYKSNGWHKDHEAGHTLNLAAFGSVFHLIGALDENVFRGSNAYAERLAESNSSGSSGSNIPMWA